MTPLEIKEILISKFGQDSVTFLNADTLQPILTIKTELIKEVCKELRDNKKTYFDFLSCLSGNDNGPVENTVEVVYHLYSIPYNSKITLKIVTPRTSSDGNLPKVPSVSEIWRTANWHEREAYDLVGIFFENHPDLRRILCPQDWEGYPLRKDYKPQETYHGIKVEY